MTQSDAVALRPTGQVKLQNTPLRLVGLHKVFTSRTQRHHRQIDLITQELIDPFDIGRIPAWDINIPIH